MGDLSKNAGDIKYQECFVTELQNNKREALDELYGNKYKVTVDDLIKHWHKELMLINWRVFL